MADNPYFDWRTKGACAALTVSEAEALFFPTNGRTIKRAKVFCETTCEVYEQCLAWALKMQPQGIIAGTTERDRRSILRLNNRHTVLINQPTKKIVKRSKMVMV